MPSEALAYRWLDLQRYIQDSPTGLPVALRRRPASRCRPRETPWHIPVTLTIYRKGLEPPALAQELSARRGVRPPMSTTQYSVVTSHLSPDGHATG